MGKNKQKTKFAQKKRKLCKIGEFCAEKIQPWLRGSLCDIRREKQACLVFWKNAKSVFTVSIVSKFFIFVFLSEFQAKSKFGKSFEISFDF